MLRTVGAPTAPEEIGITRERLRRSYWQAYCIRRVHGAGSGPTGLLEAALDHILVPPASGRLTRG